MKLLTFLVCAGWLMFAGIVDAASPGVQLRSTKGEFADVRDRVVMALENRGLVVNYTAKVGEMLDRTGRDLGRDRRIYNQAEVLEFCSAALSRDTMEADPRNIVFCPYAIAVYTLPKSPGTGLPVVPLARCTGLRAIHPRAAGCREIAGRRHQRSAEVNHSAFLACSLLTFAPDLRAGADGCVDIVIADVAVGDKT